MSKKRTFVYVDSFNLYYGVLKSMPRFKWLNIDTWIKSFLDSSKYDVQKIKFCTARVSADHDPQKPVRQDIYFRALKTIPSLEFIFGKYLSKPIKIQVTKDVKVLGKTFEEKGTDVNLAVHLVNDAHLDLFDAAVIVSNDSDLAEALKIVYKDIKKEVWVINPCINSKTTKLLMKNSTEVRVVRENHIKSSQFPSTMTDLNGVFSKPQSW